jgi:CheY-like chemotaxis protein
VLVVEDDQYLLDGLQALLEFYDGPYELQVSTAVNGLAGVEAVMRQPPNLIISDIMMPKMDGFEFLAAVRSHPDWLQIPFIFLTAKGEATDVHKGRQSGVEEYITKPYDSDELLELVTIQLNRYFELLGLAQQGFEDLKQSILQLLQTDFRTPLNSVADYSNSLASELQQAQTAADLKKSLQGIQMGSQQLSGLVENFILLAELKTGEAQNAFEVRAAMHTNLLDVLEQAVELVEVEGWPTGVHLLWEKLKLHQAILLDQEVALYALRRLVEVGCQSCLAHDGRTLTLAVRETGRDVQIEMRRDGRPFAPDLFEYIQRLFLASEEQIIDHVSYGSALCIVHGVMQLHNGHVELDNTADHVGIILHWPLSQATDTSLFN